MNLKKNLFLLLILIANITYAQDWVNTNITDFASIDFPVTSKLTKTPRETVFTAQDDFGFYIVSIRKLTDQQSSQITKDQIPTLYQGVTNGAMEAANAEIVSINDILIKEIPALEVEYLAPPHPDLPSQRFKRIVYINQHIILIDFWPLTNQEETANERKAMFFNSFSFNSNEVENTTNVINDASNETSIASKAGYLVGQVLFFVFLFAILIGIILFFRYLMRKYKKKNSTDNSVVQPVAKPSQITCLKCDFENGSETKYCTRCGFELPRN